MNWAGQRRLIIVTILGAVVLSIISVTTIATVHETPSCTDGTQNQNEAGIDCGGPCAYLCTASLQPPVTLFTRVLAPEVGRTDLVAVVANKNVTAAAKNVRYTITFYSPNRATLGTVRGTLDLTPGGGPEAGRTLIFLPRVSVPTGSIASASLDIEPSSIHWYSLVKDVRIIPHLESYALSNERSAPRVRAVFSNPSTMTLTNVKVLIAAYDATGNVLAASQTVIPNVPPQGNAEAVFTWNAPFTVPATRFDIVPVIALP